MKKAISLILAVILVVALLCPAAFAAEDINVILNGEAVVWTDAKPFLDENDRTLCPLRAVGEAMGLTVEWDGPNNTAVFSKVTLMDDAGECNETVVMKFPIDQKYAILSYEYKEYGEVLYSEEQTVEMDTAAVVVNDRTYAPVRYLAENFGYDVDWDGETNSVLIETFKGYIVYWNIFSTWPNEVGVYFSKGERFDEYKGIDIVAARVNGKPAKVRMMGAEEFKAFNEEFTGGDGVCAFYVEYDFTSEGSADGTPYVIEWDIKFHYADGTSDTEVETDTWTWENWGYGGW